MKTGEEPEATFCFGCKDFTHTFRPQTVKMTNKLLTEKFNTLLISAIKIR